jgi:hypothetical protein
MSHEAPSFKEVNGEILPVYEGVNGVLSSSGRPLSGADQKMFLPDADSLSRVEKSTTLSERAFAMAERAGAEALATATTEATIETLEERLQRLQDERDADRAGTHPGSSPSDFHPAVNRGGNITSAAKNKNEKDHRNRARRDRWGR